MSLGEFTNEEFAARKRDLYILEKHPDEIYKLNFEWTKDEIITWREKLNMEPLLI